MRRVHIPKGGSTTETRPIGIPTLEDKILQRAVVMLLEPIYEQDFLDCSYGFRPGRSAHQALESFRDQTMNCRQAAGCLEVDIRKFFDNLDHGHLRQFLRLRVRDGVLLRLIGKWLKAGVMEDGSVSYPDSGSPQGGVVSPLLSNVFLHYVLDLWFEQEVKPRLREPAFLIRYADDFVIGFRDDRDARRVMEVIPKRFDKYGLTIHPDQDEARSFPSVFARRTTTEASHDDPPARLTYWDSPTTGDDPGMVTGLSNSRPPRIASAERFGASTTGAGIIGTCRSLNNTRSSTRSYADTMRTME